MQKHPPVAMSVICPISSGKFNSVAIFTWQLSSLAGNCPYSELPQP